MGTRTLSTVITLENESGYRAALKNIAGEQRVLKSELQKVSSEYRTNANTMEALTKKGDVLSRMYSTQERQISTLKGALAKAKETREAEQESVSEAREEYDRAKAALDAYGKEVDESNEGYRKAKEDLEKWRNEVIKHQAKLDAATVAVNKYETQLNRAEVELNELSDSQEENNRLLEEAKKSFDGCATSIDRYGDVTKDASVNTKQSASAVEALSAALVAGGVQQKVEDLAGAMMDCAEASQDFELAIAKVFTLADESAVSQKEMREGILGISSDLGKGASEISEAVYQALSAGVDTANVLSFVRQSTMLSVAGFTDAANAVDVLTTILNAYHMEASQTEAVASKLAKTQDLGKVTVDELGKVLGRVIPTAAAYSVDLDNIATAYARMTAAGNNAENTTTYLSAMFDELADSGSNVAGILQKQTGKSFSELMSSGASLGDALDAIGQSVNNDKVAFSNLWSSATAGKAALALFNDGAEEFNKSLTQIANSGGAVAANYAKLADTSDYASRRVAVASENLKIAVGDQLNPVLNELRSAGANLLNEASEIVSQNPALVAVITGTVTALGLLAAGLSGLMIVKSVSAAMAALNITMAANPAILIATAIAGLGAALATFAAQAREAEAEVAALSEAANALNDRAEVGAQAYNDAVASAEAASATAEIYIDRLAELEAQGLSTNAQQMEYKMLLDKINELLPGINIEIDAQTGLVKGGTDALREQSEAWRKNALMEAAYARHRADLDAMATAQYEVAKNTVLLTDAEEEQKNIEEQMSSVKQRLNELVSQRNNLNKNGGMSAQKYREQYSLLTVQINELSAEYSGLDSQLQANKEHQDDLTQAISSGNEAVAENQKLITAGKEALIEMEEQYGSTGEGIGSISQSIADSIRESVQEAQKSYEEMKNAAHNSIDSQIGLFDDLSGKSEMSVEKMIESLNSQRVALEGYASNLDLALHRGIDVGLVQRLSDGSAESVKILAELVTATDEQIAALNAEFAGVGEAKDTVAGAMTDIAASVTGGIDEAKKHASEKGYELGTATGDGAIAGLRSRRAAFSAAASQFADAGFKGYKKVSLINSPSKRWMWLGQMDTEGTLAAYKQAKPRMEQASTELANSGYLAAIRARKAAISTVISKETSMGPATDPQTIQLLQKILVAVQSGKTIVLDSGAFVGATADQYDAAMGQIKALTDRGAL